MKNNIFLICILILSFKALTHPFKYEFNKGDLPTRFSLKENQYWSCKIIPGQGESIKNLMQFFYPYGIEDEKKLIKFSSLGQNTYEVNFATDYFLMFSHQGFLFGEGAEYILQVKIKNSNLTGKITHKEDSKEAYFHCDSKKMLIDDTEYLKQESLLSLWERLEQSQVGACTMTEVANNKTKSYFNNAKLIERRDVTITTVRFTNKKGFSKDFTFNKKEIVESLRSYKSPYQRKTIYDQHIYDEYKGIDNYKIFQRSNSIEGIKVPIMRDLVLSLLRGDC